VDNLDEGGIRRRLPVSLLTGFLGSGKTTVLNHLIKIPDMPRTLIIINEFGEIGIDHELLVRSEEDIIVEASSGCLCCTIRGDLVRTLKDALWRFSRNGEPWFERVIIETTGLADPAPILHTLMTDPIIASSYRLDGVITTVDAASGLKTLEMQSESVKQAAVADRVLITKSDLVPEDEMRSLELRLLRLNPGAKFLKVINGIVDPEKIFNAGLYNPTSKSLDVQKWLNEEAFSEPGHAHKTHGHGHDVNRHDERIKAVCLRIKEPIQQIAFDRWLEMVLMFNGADVLRMKGIVNIREFDKPIVIHGVHHIFHPPVILDAWPSEDRESRIVFIVRDMDEIYLQSIMDLFVTKSAEKVSSDVNEFGGVSNTRSRLF